MRIDLIKADPSLELHFVNDSFNFVPEMHATRFIAKRRNSLGFQEFFGYINDPEFIFDSDYEMPRPKLPISEEVDYFTKYGLNVTRFYQYKDKKVPIYIPKNFLAYSPHSFAGKERTLDEIAQNGAHRRDTIYRYYKTMHEKFVGSLSEVKCTSVAELYEYVTDGDVWPVGGEAWGFVDGLWETGSYLTISVDTNNWDGHTAIHELSHSVSYFLRDDLFDEYYKIAADVTEKPSSEYGKTEMSEDFAEAGAYYFGLPQNRIILREKCPRRYAYMKKIDKLGGDALIDDLTATVELSRRFLLYNKVVYPKK